MRHLPLFLFLVACGGSEPTGDVITTDVITTDDPTPPVDADGDGSPADLDCDDDDDSVFPGQTERCNGVDDDCDDLVDEEASDAPTWYADDDADGAGDPDDTLQACDTPAGFVDTAGDCDDANPALFPRARTRPATAWTTTATAPRTRPPWTPPPGSWTPMGTATATRPPPPPPAPSRRAPRTRAPTATTPTGT